MKGTVGKTAAAGLAVGVGVLAAVKRQDDRYVDGIWRALEEAPATTEAFTEEMIAGLPDPARRYFLHMIRPGMPLASRIRFSYSGFLRPGKEIPWMDLQAHQIMVKERGFVWKARVQKGPLLLTGTDHYLDGDSRMRIGLYGLVPVVSATGPDLSRSALARLLMESILIPAALLPGPHLQIEGVDDSHFTAVVTLQGETTPLTLRVSQEGRLEELVLPRWGNLTADGSYRYIPYGIAVEEEGNFGSYNLPAQMRGGWWYGTRDYLEVIRIRMNWVEFR